MALQPCRAITAAASLTAGRRAATRLRRPFTSTANTPSTTTTTTTQPPRNDQDIIGQAIQRGKVQDSAWQRTGSQEEKGQKPRWSETPERMKAPMQMDFAKDPRNKIWVVNSDPARLDTMYNRLLGPGGSKMLPDELKWLAVTHKSFDYGRRGFNDRLAMMGRMALVLEATMYIVNKPPDPKTAFPDPYHRKPHKHPQLSSIDNLAIEGPRQMIGKEKLYALALGVGMPSVIRWKPRMTHRLKESGVEVVFSAAIMAIVGAINLQHGAAVSSAIIRDRIFLKLPKSTLPASAPRDRVDDSRPQSDSQIVDSLSSASPPTLQL
ncbi:hypothetical protein L249_7723 [Ophiocordyceps polyrhachis-furcata BCC 54312]|uniref:RNase III domain-containing protein n=1 Tax=Ophiocordyceps polyrhachis-furcata BCC 54312 TaxID=1330021 RepID=A0A367LB60_9HYPO|nr:hypothetical protein L249_7723 [Ophiocordyceps polyrhachis-furcata BCC 54312]